LRQHLPLADGRAASIGLREQSEHERLAHHAPSLSRICRSLSAHACASSRDMNRCQTTRRRCGECVPPQPSLPPQKWSSHDHSRRMVQTRSSRGGFIVRDSSRPALSVGTGSDQGPTERCPQRARVRGPSSRSRRSGVRVRTTCSSAHLYHDLSKRIRRESDLVRQQGSPSPKEPGLCDGHRSRVITVHARDIAHGGTNKGGSHGVVPWS
jgi:hypothetical protein